MPKSLRLAFAGLVAILLASAAPASGETMVQGPHATDDPMAVHLAKQEGIPKDRANLLLREQSRSINSISNLSQKTGVPEEMFRLDRKSAKLKAVALTRGQVLKLRSLGVDAKLGSYTVPDLEALRERAWSLIGQDKTRIYDISVDVYQQSIIIAASPDFASSAIGKTLSGIAGIIVQPRLVTGPPAPASGALAGLYMTGPLLCTQGFVTYDNRMLTAGHCTYYPKLGLTQLGKTYYDGAGLVLGKTTSSHYQNNGYDRGTITFAAGININDYQYANYVTGTTNIGSNGHTYFEEYICKYGTKSGVTCGYGLGTNVQVVYDGTTVIKDVSSTTACVQGGDSGAPVFGPSSRAVALVSAGAANQTCARNSGGSSAGQMTSYISNLPGILAAYNTLLGYNAA